MIDESDIQALTEFVQDNQELDKLETILEDFNVFVALGAVNDEERHSTFLGWLLDPTESHGLGDYFLSVFLKHVALKAALLGVPGPSVFDIESWHFDDAEVLREWRSIDVLVRCGTPGLVCAIENKIWSGEHDNQLQRYADTVVQEYPSYQKLFVYLTVEGEPPSDERFVPFSHAEVVQLIERLVAARHGKLGDEVSVFLTHYIEMMRRYIMKDSQVQEICRKIYKRHKRALDLIFEYRPDVQSGIYDCLVEILSNDPDLELDDSSKSQIRFWPKSLDFIPREGNGWTKSKRMLLFEAKNWPDGLVLYLEIGPGSAGIRERLYQLALEDPKLFNVHQSHLYPQWHSIYKRSLAAAREYEDKGQDEIRALLQEKLNKFKETDLPRIEAAIGQLRTAFPASEVALSDSGVLGV